MSMNSHTRTNGHQKDSGQEHFSNGEENKTHEQTATGLRILHHNRSFKERETKDRALVGSPVLELQYWLSTS